MDGNLTDYLPGSFYRTPDWRWRRARALREPGSRVSRMDDAWVIRAREFLGTSRPGGDAQAKPIAGNHDPAVAAAVRLAQADTPTERWLLEAHLLTGESLESVAAHCALPIDTVEAYEKLFFNVTPHLAATDWVLTQAIQCGPWNNFGGEQSGGMWKYLAYTGGPCVLEVAVATTLRRPMPAWVGTSLGRYASLMDTSLRLSCHLVAKGLTTDSPAVLRALVRIGEEARRITADVFGGKERVVSMLQPMKFFLKEAGRQGRTCTRTATVVVPAVKEVVTTTPHRISLARSTASPSLSRVENGDSRQGGESGVATLLRAAPAPRVVTARQPSRLTPQGLATLRQTALSNRPWLYSTGPRTPEGKARMALNGKSRQKGPRSVREVRADVAELRALVRELRAGRRAADGLLG